MADITPIASLNGELAMPEKVWMQGPPGPQGQQGEPGAAATVTVGTVTTGEPGTDAIVTNSGTESAAVLNFTIPKGETGAVGAAGPQGPRGDKGDPGPAGAGVPDGGTVGQLLSKTESGTAWIDPPQSGGGGSVPKPLTYDYMPEGYPTKSVQTTTLMEEQELAFTSTMGAYAATLTNVLEIVAGQTYTVNWDGIAYERVCSDFNSMPYLGNLSIIGIGDDTGEPFLYVYNISQSVCQFVTTDTSASHTISVKTTAETVTPMTYDYMPEGYPTKSVQTTTLMKERELAFTAGRNDAYGATPPHKFVTVEGKTYTVNWDGTEYECVCVVYKTKLALGNLSIMGNGDDTGEPFLCHPTDPIFITLDTSASHTISVKTTEEVITPMAEEFLPNIPADKLSAADALYIKSSTADSTKQFKITVDDSGTISATEVT